MTLQDTPTHRALIAADHSLEMVDLREFLDVSGWQEMHCASNAERAMSLLSSGTYNLVIVALSQADARTAGITRQAVTSGAGVISIDAARSAMRHERIALVARPYVDSDLIDALMRLGMPIV